MDSEAVVRALAALAHPLRLEVFRALVAADPDGLTPGTMAAALAVPQNTLSFHLKELRGGGLVTQGRAGRHLVYRADYERGFALLAYLTEHCCRAAPPPAAAPPLAR